MQITPEQLLAEAGRMALELRLKDQALDALAAENRELRAQLAGDPESSVPPSPDISTGGQQ